MDELFPPRVRRIASLLAVVAAFIIASYLAHRYEDQIALVLSSTGAASMVLFVGFIIVFVVFAIPLDLVLLVPLGAHVWGPVPTALLCIAGWSLGALLALLVARRWGMPVVARLIGRERIENFHDRIPKGQLFWSVILLRMLIPVDILSYALGLFSTMSWSRYFLATMIGVTPFAFFFAFAGTLPVGYQIVSFMGAFVLVSLILLTYGKRIPDR